MDVNHPLPYADHVSGRMHSLLDGNHPLPYAEIEFADPFG